MKKEISNDLERVVDNYRKQWKEHLIALAIFGSYARGEETPRSDIDILLIANHLPKRKFERESFIRKPAIGILKKKFNVIAWTQEEFETNFSSIYLDLGQDAVIYYDPSGYLKKKLEKIKQITEEAKLERVKLPSGYVWRWKSPERYGKLWSIDWSGYRELKR